MGNICRRGQRTVAALLVGCLVLTSTSCALLFTKGPPRGHEQMTFFNCTEKSDAAVTDVIMAVLWSVAVVPAVAYGWSAYTGIKRVRACKTAKRNLAQAWETLQRTAEGQRPDATITAVVIAPTPDTLRIGHTVQLHTAAVNINAATITGRMFLWTSSNDAIASVDAAGVVSAKALGSATIKAATGGVAATKNVVVLPPP